MSEKLLVDDLAEVLACTVVGWEKIIGHDLAEAPEVKRVLARYRNEKEMGALAVGDIVHHDMCAVFSACNCGADPR